MDAWHLHSADGQFGGLPPQLTWHQVSDMAGLTALHEVGSPWLGLGLGLGLANRNRNRNRNPSPNPNLGRQAGDVRLHQLLVQRLP